METCIQLSGVLVDLEVERRKRAPQRIPAPGELALLDQTLSCEKCGLKHARAMYPEAIGPFKCRWCGAWAAKVQL